MSALIAKKDHILFSQGLPNLVSLFFPPYSHTWKNRMPTQAEKYSPREPQTLQSSVFRRPKDQIFTSFWPFETQSLKHPALLPHLLLCHTAGAASVGQKDEFKNIHLKLYMWLVINLQGELKLKHGILLIPSFLINNIWFLLPFLTPLSGAPPFHSTKDPKIIGVSTSINAWWQGSYFLS